MPSRSDASRSSSDATAPGRDHPASLDRTDVEEYWLIRRAFRDAIWDVVGSVLALVFAWVLFVVGGSLVVSGLSGGGGTGDYLLAAFGLVLSTGAVVQFLRELRIFPFD